jgi:RNA polymerase sigma-70 factor (ECF subfamily)
MSGSVSAVHSANRELVSRPYPNGSDVLDRPGAIGIDELESRRRDHRAAGMSTAGMSSERRVRTQTQLSNPLVSRAVKRAQAGDREALGFLYVHFADNVYGYVRSIVHDHHEAEDVTQQVFAKLIGVIGKYEERDVPFFAWILRVSRNVAVDHIRRQRLIPVEEVRTSDEGGGDPAGGARMNDLREALSTLPKDQREVLVLRHVAGLSPTEIATRTGRSEGSIHGLHHRGRKALKAELTSRGAAPSTADSRRPSAAGLSDLSG